MLIKIHTQGFTLSNAINVYVDEKIRLALGLYRGKIQRADVYLTDVNGPKGGKDMQCKINIKADGQPAVFAEYTAENLYDSISGCSQRIKRAVKRRFARLLQQRHVGTKKLIVDQGDKLQSAG